MPLLTISPPIVPTRKREMTLRPFTPRPKLPEHFWWLIENETFSSDVMSTPSLAASILSKRRVKGENYIITAEVEEQSDTIKNWWIFAWCWHSKQTRVRWRWNGVRITKERNCRCRSTQTLISSTCHYLFSRPYDTKIVPKKGNQERKKTFMESYTQKIQNKTINLVLFTTQTMNSANVFL